MSHGNVTEQVLAGNPYAAALGNVNTCPSSAEYLPNQEGDHVLGKVSQLIKQIDNYLQHQAARFPLFYVEIRGEPDHGRRLEILHTAEMIYEEYMMLLFLRKLMLRGELKAKLQTGPYITLRADRTAVITANDKQGYDEKVQELFKYIDRHKTPTVDNPVARIRGVEEFFKVPKSS